MTVSFKSFYLNYYEEKSFDKLVSQNKFLLKNIFKVSNLPPSDHFPPGYVVSYSVTYIYINVLVFVIFPKVGNRIQKQSFAGVFKIIVLKISQYSRLSWSLFLIKLKACMYVAVLKATPTQVFSSEYYKIFKDTFFIEHLSWLFLSINPNTRKG